METDEARTALRSIEAARRRRGRLTAPPPWLYWGLALCMIVCGLAYSLDRTGRIVVQAAVIAAVLVLSVVAERSAGVGSRLTRPPARGPLAWIGFVAAVAGAVLVSELARRAGAAPLGFYALAIVIVTVGPRLRRGPAR